MDIDHNTSMRSVEEPVADYKLDAELVKVLIRCIFIRIIIELKTYRIYNMVIRSTKTVTRYLSETSNFTA
jgi:hypothetical protein